MMVTVRYHGNTRNFLKSDQPRENLHVTKIGTFSFTFIFILIVYVSTNVIFPCSTSVVFVIFIQCSEKYHVFVAFSDIGIAANSCQGKVFECRI